MHIYNQITNTMLKVFNLFYKIMLSYFTSKNTARYHQTYKYFSFGVNSYTDKGQFNIRAFIYDLAII